MKSIPKQRIPIQVGPDRLLDALRTISVYDAPPGRRAARHFLDYAHATSMRVDRCWAMLNRETNRIGPAAIVLPNRGRTGMVFVSPPDNDTQVGLLASLLEHVHLQLEPAEVVLMQGLCTKSDTRSIRAFCKAGFTHLADLDYLQMSLKSVTKTPAPTPEPRITFSDYEEPKHHEIKRILEESYVNTRDCPGLCGLRSSDDILRDHIGVGVSDPALWITAYLDRKAAGILMLNPLPDGRIVELSYIGVAHWARGQAIARRLLHLGFDRLAQRSFETVVLAVDHANDPARRIYDSLGFHCTDQRRALIRPVTSSSTESITADSSSMAAPASRS